MSTMHKKEQALQQLRQQKLLPLYYHDDADVSVDLFKTLYEAGIRMVEYTNRGPHALHNFVVMKKAAEDMAGMQIGIGTIKNAEDAKKFIEAGADFIVCPTMNEAVAEVVHREGLLWIPGCMTATEIAAAEAAGATVVKIFPGNILGPSYISAIKELFPGLQFMPTGGVEAEASNLKDWFNAGVVAVGMGSKLLAKNLVEQRNYQQLKQDTEQVLQLLKNLG